MGPPTMSSRRWVCPACTLLCDDVQLTTEELEKLRNALRAARAPLITGIQNLTVVSQQTAVKVAEKFSAYLDVGSNNRGSAGLASFQRHGKVTATLGEIAGRSDLVLLWYCDPQRTHPRFVERFLRGSGESKKIIVVDSLPNSTAKMADDVVIHIGDHEELIWQLRSLAGGSRQGKEGAGSDATKIYEQIVAAKYASVILGSGWPEIVVDPWHQLARELNSHTRFVLSSLRADRNAAGAEQVLASLTGFPEAIRFAGGKPTYNGSEYASANLLARRECDFVLFCDVGADLTFEKLVDPEILKFLASIPVAVLTDFPPDQYQCADFVIPVATPGLSCGGDFHRLDDISIPLTSPELTPAAEPRAILGFLLS